jgi:transcriptional regulator with GAF, ATPase, and Fis domain
MMSRAVTITMTMRELDRLKTVQAVADRMLRVSQAAERLGMSRRQVHRLVLRYEDEGPQE